ncbi:MAG: hypothetical protein ACFBQW_05105 [Sphingomonadaceae bacterium]
MAYGWIEIVFTSTVILGLAVWQLVSVNREIRRDKEKSDAARHPVGEHELDERR